MNKLLIFLLLCGCATEYKPFDDYANDKVFARYKIQKEEAIHKQLDCRLTIAGALEKFKGKQQLSKREYTKINKYCEHENPIPTQPEECK